MLTEKCQLPSAWGVWARHWEKGERELVPPAATFQGDNPVQGLGGPSCSGRHAIEGS